MNKEGLMSPLRTILFATDFSKSAACAFDLACTLARDHAAKLVILHVATPPPIVMPEGVVVEVNDAAYRADLKKQLSAVRPTDSSIRVEHQLELGDPATEILRVAKEAGADWLVMGTHGRTGLFRLLMGSVAEQVLRGASCPVLTVRMPPEK
jgi:nucleotide-binding universal stress UspA family protein